MDEYVGRSPPSSSVPASSSPWGSTVLISNTPFLVFDTYTYKSRDAFFSPLLIFKTKDSFL